jgi:hypothetical protein
LPSKEKTRKAKIKSISSGEGSYSCPEKAKESRGYETISPFFKRNALSVSMVYLSF